MSHRKEDANFIGLLRDIQARLKRLERGENGVRQNTFRLGDAVVSLDEEFYRLKIDSLSDDRITKWLPDTDQSWSWPSEIDVTPLTEFGSPVYTGARYCTISEFVVTLLTASTSDITVSFHNGSNSQDISITAGKTTAIFPADIDVSDVHPGTRMWVTLQLAVAPATPGQNLAVTARFKG